MQELRCSPAETSNSATGSRVFCVRPPWVSCAVRAALDGQLLRDAAAAAAAPDPALFLSPPPFLSSSLQSRQQGLRTPKVFIQSKPRGVFHQLDERLRLSSHDVSRPRIHQALLWQRHRRAQVACFLLPPKWVLILFGVEWNGLFTRGSFIWK